MSGEFDDKLDIEKMIAESKYLLADCDCLVAEAKMLIRQREVREARCKEYSLNRILLEIFVLLPLKIMLGFCNTILFLPFDDGAW